MASAQRTFVFVPGSNHLYANFPPLFVLRNANMAITTDQAFVKCGAFGSYYMTQVAAKRVSGAFNTACAGGIYTAAAKGGDALVAAAQTWETLTGASTMKIATTNIVVPDAGGAQTKVYTQTPVFSLSTGNSAALVADIFMWGIILD